MPKKAPTPDTGNAPQGILEPPEPVVVDVAPLPIVDVPLAPEVAPEPVRAPGVYSGVWPNLVLTATVDENGDMVQVPEAPSATT